MRLLITRPEDDASALAALLAKRGHAPIIAPVMEVRFPEGAEIDLSSAQAVIATSANGVRAIAGRTKRRDIPVFAVGPQTAEAARQAKFKEVKSADGDAAALAENIPSWADPKKGALYHAAGAETAGKLAATLHAKGFTVASDVLYEAAPVTALPEKAAAALREQKLDGVLLFSPRSAKIFAGLVAEANLAESCAKLDAYCISAATASALAPLAFSRVVVAANPNQDAMLALITG